jgi:hypothetical protein
MVLDAGDGRAVDPVAGCRRLRRVDEPTARAEIHRLAVLVAAAGVAWVDGLLHRLETR